MTKRLGGDGINTPTDRTLDETITGIYWGYDNPVWIGVPIRFHLQVAHKVALEHGTSESENARLFAVLALTLADASISSFKSKYENAFWRPIVAIRAGDNDLNKVTKGDPTWTPLGSQRSNKGGIPFSPNFPAYSAGHAALCGASMKTLAFVFGSSTSFSFVSDEYNGTTTNGDGSSRPYVKKHFDSFHAAAEECAFSRVYLGVHWDWDGDSGLFEGDKVATYAQENLMLPLNDRNHHELDTG